MDSADSPGPHVDALELFSSWLSQRESTSGTEFDELLRTHPSFARELEGLHTTWRLLVAAGDVSAALEDPEAPLTAASDSFGLIPRSDTTARYKLEGEVARGGMGAILRVWDKELRRHLAMKVALDTVSKASGDAKPRSEDKRLARFLEEARVAGQLDHPGMVPVHELGLDGEGRLYFTMKLVEGRDMKQIFEFVLANREGWNQTRALGVILKVCEAMAYAHSKGVIHRDLKPANVMVGSFGEVFVMDWGLARVLQRPDPHDIRFAPQDTSLQSAARARPAATSDEQSRSALMTMDGVVLGTPAYMPPEQARGEIEKLSPRSDIYSIGAMLYHLLARKMPYDAPAAHTDHRYVLRLVLAGPPAPLQQMNAAVPPELVAICEKAMARDAQQRYPDMRAFAEDLRAYLENRVVAAYEAGAVAELRKWITRNRALAYASAAAIGILVIGLVVSSSLFVTAKQESERADAKAADLVLVNAALARETTRAEEKADEAEGQRRIAERRSQDVLSLSAGRDLQELVARADALWPTRPENVAQSEGWLRDAHALLEGRPADAQSGLKGRPGLADHREKLAELEARALPPTDAELAAVTPGSAESAVRKTWRFENGDDAWWHAQLTKLIADLEAFSNVETGLCSAGTNPEHGWGIAKRLEIARTLDERSVSGPNAAKRWREAILSIRDRAQCPLYDGLEISPQLGLLPIGRDAVSGLWEFAHIPSGEPVEPDEDGAVALNEGDGLVLVLIPGGSFWMGSQRTDPAGLNYDPMSDPVESPTHQVSLDAYFLSKFEMTQDQWGRFTGKNPSAYGPGTVLGGNPTTPLHPVEQVSWKVAMAAMERLDLVLPTEAQWERGARAGTSTAWWTGSDPQSLRGAGNIADSFAKQHDGPTTWPFEEWLNDGYKVHAPVGKYRANAFGLHDVMGNLYEICRDGYGTYDMVERLGDGERLGADPRSHMIRGGAYHNPARRSRAAFRTDVAPQYSDYSIGLRPARPLTP